MISASRQKTEARKPIIIITRMGAASSNDACVSGTSASLVTTLVEASIFVRIPDSRNITILQSEMSCVNTTLREHRRCHVNTRLAEHRRYHVIAMLKEHGRGIYEYISTRLTEHRRCHVSNSLTEHRRYM
jgi:methylphosphotriester-DNA--protein-cysteine methyltransferase